LIVGWLVFFYITYKVTLIEVEHKEYDPFAIIGIDRV
jgi:preprotein translocase subunit Sec63